MQNDLHLRPGPGGGFQKRASRVKSFVRALYHCGRCMVCCIPRRQLRTYRPQPNWAGLLLLLLLLLCASFRDYIHATVLLPMFSAVCVRVRVLELRVLCARRRLPGDVILFAASVLLLSPCAFNAGSRSERVGKKIDLLIR